MELWGRESIRQKPRSNLAANKVIMDSIIQVLQCETLSQLSGKNWIVTVHVSPYATNCWDACSFSNGDTERICCGNRELAAKEAIQFVLTNIWENL